MFINIKLSSIFKIFCIIVTIVMIVFFGVGVYTVITKSNKAFTVTDKVKQADVVELTTSNYTNVLKTVHDNIDSYVGTKIHFTGFVYRVFDFSETQFVLARNMTISPDGQAVVVGFLCDYKDAKNFPDNTWIEVNGSITKGDYHGKMPIIEITEIKQVDPPTDEFVYPPDDSFIPTSALL